MNELEKNDDIYLSKYSGWYSVSDEAFYNEDEIEDIDGVKRSISSKSSVEWIEEESYFFRYLNGKNRYLIIMNHIQILLLPNLEK